jgi:hypothetical protein
LSKPVRGVWIADAARARIHRPITTIQMMTISWRGARLMCMAALAGGCGRGVALLRPAGRDAFSDHEYVLILFQRDVRGRIIGMTASTPRVHNLRFDRRGD